MKIVLVLGLVFALSLAGGILMTYQTVIKDQSDLRTEIKSEVSALNSLSVIFEQKKSKTSIIPNIKPLSNPIKIEFTEPKVNTPVQVIEEPVGDYFFQRGGFSSQSDNYKI
jgi:hypothetical protein